MNNVQQLELAQSYLGQGGYTFRKFCGLGSGQPYCAAFVSYIFYKAGNADLFCDGRKQINCIPIINWCFDNLPNIPLYLAMESDIAIFDWNDNEIPDHIGLAAERRSASELTTIEGNTSGGIVAMKTRPAGDIQALFRPAFRGSFDISKYLTVDGCFGYSSIAMLQLVLKQKGYYTGEIDGILGRKTVKALQRLVGVNPDASWGPATSKAIQKMLGIKADGWFGEESTKALQSWINANVKLNAKDHHEEVQIPATVKKPEPESTLLAVDGFGGKKTVKALQKFLGIEITGVIDGQSESDTKYCRSLISVKYGKGGSITVKWLQRWLGMDDADGYWGKNTSKKLQKAIGAEADGYFGTESMKALQEYLNKHPKASYPDPKPKPEPTLEEKILKACKEQAKWMKNYRYEWQDHPTVEKSKYKGTCVTYIACVLQRLGYLDPGEAIWHDRNGKVDGANKKMKVIYPSGHPTLKSLRKTLKPGDIVMTGDPKSTQAGGESHIFAVTGEWSDAGNPYIWDNNSATRIKNKKSGKHTFGSGNRVIAIVRLKG